MIESVYRGRDIFGWYVREMIDSLLDASSRCTILSVNLCCISVVLNGETLFLLQTSVRRQVFIADIVNTCTQVRTLIELRVNNRRQR